MTVERQENLKFKGVNFISLNYNCNKPHEEEDIDMDIIPSIFLHQNSETFEIIMNVKISAEGSFEITTTAIGTFVILNPGEEYRHNFMNVNAPAIMFPYVRSFLSTITASFGKTTGTIIIPAQTFSGELEVINPPPKDENH